MDRKERGMRNVPCTVRREEEGREEEGEKEGKRRRRRRGGEGENSPAHLQLQLLYEDGELLDLLPRDRVGDRVLTAQGVQPVEVEAVGEQVEGVVSFREGGGEGERAAGLSRREGGSRVDAKLILHVQAVFFLRKKQYLHPQI